MLSSRIKVGALFILLLVALTGKAQNRIIGGNITDISNRPYQVAVFVDNQFEGGGVIVNRQWIITAAHVVYGYSTQIYFDGGNMHLVYNKTSDQIQIKSADSSAPISAKQENTIKYVIFNSNNGTVASQGVLPSGSNTIDCGKLRNGLYTVTVICGGKKTSKTFIK